jgi:hypothetical protein
VQWFWLVSFEIALNTRIDTLIELQIPFTKRGALSSNKKLLKGVNDLATTNPELAKDWHPTKNLPLTSSDVFAGTGKIIWWQCSDSPLHQWPARGINRFNGAGCPFCSGRKPVPGVNDLGTVNPSLAKQWHPTRNGKLHPSEFLPNSHKKVWWLCTRNSTHEWEATIGHRLRTDCPICANRKVSAGDNDLAVLNPELTKEWNFEKNIDLRPESVSAGSHRVVWWLCKKYRHEWRASIVSRQKGNGCPICANKIVLAGFNDLCTTHPQLAKEWDTERNQGLDSASVMAGSPKKVWWICNKHPSHHWYASVAPRASRGVGCPICANLQLLQGFNDFETTNPGLATEWHPQKNGALSASSVVSGTNTVVWWQCTNVSSHTWKATVTNRMKGTGCPDCANAGFKTTSPGLFYYLTNDSLGASKIGITNINTKKQRVADFQKSGWRVNKTWQDQNGLVILNLETKMLRWIRKEIGVPPFLSPSEMGRQGGWSETFSTEAVEKSEVLKKVESELVIIKAAISLNQ